MYFFITCRLTIIIIIIPFSFEVILECKVAVVLAAIHDLNAVVILSAQLAKHHAIQGVLTYEIRV